MRTDLRSRRPLAVAMWVISSSAGFAQFAPTGQFAPFTAPPYEFDEITGEWINLETELVEPIVFVPAGSGQPAVLVVANDPDDRVVFLDADLNLIGEVVVGQGPASIARNPDAREVWVSVRNQSCVVVIDLSSRTVTHVLRPPIDPDDFGAGNSSTPGGIAFANGKAYVAATFSDELLVYRASDKAFLGSIPLVAQHHDLPVALNDPFGVTSFGGRIFVTSHLSGNNTTSRIADGIDLEDPFVGVGNLGPDQVTIEKLLPASGLSLPDFDVAIVDPVSDLVTGMVKGVGTVLFTATGNPANGRVVVTNLEARNAEFVGEEAFPEGKVVFNRLTWIDPATATVFGAPVVTEALGAGAVNLVMPTDAEISTSGRMYVAGYGSSNVAIFGPAGAFEGAIATPAGPRGLAIARSLGRLYCLNRAANSVTSYDVSSPSVIPTGPLATFALVDPTPDRVKAGRIEFLKPNSGAGTASCASCHIDGRMDGGAWNLSKTLSDNPTGPNPDFRDRKGVMVTQDLRGLNGTAPFHWRGEQKDIEDFNGAFEELLKGEKLAEPELALFKDYVMSLEFPPNPRQQMNRVLSPEALLGQQGDGSVPPKPFFGVDFNLSGQCGLCHSLPLAASADILDNLTGDEALAISVEVTALRGLWTKTSAEADIDSNSTAVEMVQSDGYGVLHEGVIDSLEDFMVEAFPGIVSPEKEQIEEFIHGLDTGLGPATMYSEQLDATTANTPRADSIELYLLPQAEAGNCDVAARGLLDLGAGMVAVGLVYRPPFGATPGQFELDDAQQAPLSFAQLETKAAANQARLLFMGVPHGCGDRVGVDRDRDGMRDTDELQHNPPLDPDDPDFDNDGLWDSYDQRPVAPGLGAPNGAPLLVGEVKLLYRTTNTIKLSYETSTFSPTIVRFGTSPGALLHTAGDGLQTTGPGTSNHWKKRHTVFLRPQPLADPPLTMLEPDTEYFFEVITQGQNGAQASSGLLGGPATDFMTLKNFPGIHTFRASALEFTTKTDNGDGTFTYAVRATFEVTQGLGQDTLAGALIPGRFTIYDSTGNYAFTNLVAFVSTDAGGIHTATFSVQTLAGQQASGDRVTFDLPMWAPIPIPAGGTINIPFPRLEDDNGTPNNPTDDFTVFGQWSDSVSFIETDAP